MLERTAVPGQSVRSGWVVRLWAFATTTWFGGHVSRQLTPAHTKRQPHRHCLTVFFTVAFAVSWAAWLPAILSVGTSGDPATGLPLRSGSVRCWPRC